MDNVNNLHHGQHERTIVKDIRLSSTRDGVTQLRPDDLKPLVLETPEHAMQLVEQYAKLKLPRTSVEAFAATLIAKNAWFVQTGEVGLVYLSGIIPGYYGYLDVVFWDQKLHRNRKEVVKMVMAEAFEKFELMKISVSVPVSNVPLKSFYRDIGFVMEGTLRRMWPSQPPTDLWVLGMLREELKCSLLPRPKTSLV